MLFYLILSITLKCSRYSSTHKYFLAKYYFEALKKSELNREIPSQQGIMGILSHVINPVFTPSSYRIENMKFHAIFNLVEREHSRMHKWRRSKGREY